ncbi:MAG: lytic transglycosylase [Candidatus Contendobacter odensis]|uniref:Lytic transglycosylase n=1 Tax=Candidatus Contendibacter odensensis TaxID=1400860 RepID=A0A2G6PFF3_9GAMM|nr:MAG: lytic transglycosylase [Candidatus Contendobacter odensis]
MRQWLFAGLIPVALALSFPVQADIYAYVDSKGVRHLSNVRNNPRYKLVMRTPKYSKAARRSTSFAPGSIYGSGRAAVNTYYHSRSFAGLSARAQRKRQRFAADIHRIAAQNRIDPELMHAVIKTESAYNPRAVSPAGAVGLMQLMPATARRFGVYNRRDPIANMRGGARYLRWLLNHFNGNLRLAVAAYNAGEGAVKKYGNNVPPYRETQNYVRRVLGLYRKYRGNGMGTRYASIKNYRTHSGGVTVITPRKGAQAKLRTALRPTGDRVLSGASGSRKSPVVVNVNSKGSGSRSAWIAVGNQ